MPLVFAFLGIWLSSLQLGGDGAATGEVKLDWPKILRYGPVSGEISFVLEEELVAGAFPSLLTCDIEITIQDPDGWRKVINCDYRGHVDRALHDKKVYRPGRYVIPFCILKDHGDEFIFSKTGLYRIEFELSDKIPVVSTFAHVEVVDCSDCDPQKYLEFFGRRRLLAPFDDGFKPYEQVEGLGEYEDPFEIVASYDTGGGNSTVLAFRWGTVDAVWLTEERLERMESAINSGLAFSGRSRCNREFWALMEKRAEEFRTALLEGREKVAYSDSVYFLIGSNW